MYGVIKGADVALGIFTTGAEDIGSRTGLWLREAEVPANVYAGSSLGSLFIATP